MRAALAALLLLLPAVAACGDDGGSAEGAGHMLFASDMPFDPVQGTFIRDTIADMEALEIPDAERNIYEGNARDLLRMYEHAA